MAARLLTLECWKGNLRSCVGIYRLSLSCLGRSWDSTSFKANKDSRMKYKRKQERLSVVTMTMSRWPHSFRLAVQFASPKHLFDKRNLHRWWCLGQHLRRQLSRSMKKWVSSLSRSKLRVVSKLVDKIRRNQSWTNQTLFVKRGRKAHNSWI